MIGVFRKWQRARAATVDVQLHVAAELAFGRAAENAPVPPELVERLVDLLDSGALDATIERLWPPSSAELQPRRYADVKPFSDDDWKRRHGVRD